MVEKAFTIDDLVISNFSAIKFQPFKRYAIESNKLYYDIISGYPSYRFYSPIKLNHPLTTPVTAMITKHIMRYMGYTALLNI